MLRIEGFEGELYGSFQVCLSAGAILRRALQHPAPTMCAYEIPICPRGQVFVRNTSTISALAFAEVLALVIRSSPRNNNLKCRPLVYDAQYYVEIMGHNAESPEGIITTLKEKSAVFPANGYRSRPVRAENMGSVLCDTRGKLSPKAPHPICQRGPFQGARQLTALSSSNAVCV